MQEGLIPNRKRSVASLATMSLLASLALAVSSPSPSRAARKNTPRDKVLVVSNNMYETAKKDMRKLGDMYNFVDRVMKKTPFAPDVVLLQEISHRGAAAIAKRLSNRTGDQYRIAKDAAPVGESPWKRIGNDRLLGRDNAILMNTDTMKKTGKGGYFKFGYKQSQAKRGSAVKVKEHAYVPLKKKGTNIEMPAVSLHFPKEREFRSGEISKKLKKRWSAAIARKLNRKYPAGGNDDHMKVIGGDFNNFRCEGRAGFDCNQTPAYNILVGRFNYTDSILKTGEISNPIDFLFSSNNVCKAAIDKPWSPKPGKPGYYSNHRLRWALLEGKPDTCKPTGLGRIDPPDRFADHLRIQGWNVSFDGGSGFKEYQVFRKGPNDSDFVLRDTISNQFKKDYEDFSVQTGLSYRYYVVASDFAGNLSKPTNIVEAAAR
jgi:hypothetical protein